MGLGNTHQEVIFGLLVGANNKIDTVMPVKSPAERAKHSSQWEIIVLM